MSWRRSVARWYKMISEATRTSQMLRPFTWLYIYGGQTVLFLEVPLPPCTYPFSFSCSDLLEVAHIPHYFEKCVTTIAAVSSVLFPR
jgi:hypothetical protein